MPLATEIHMKHYIRFIASVILCLQTSLASQEYQGEINGAQYTVKVPDTPNGQLIILAHGYRPVELPLTADYGASNTLIEDLLDTGWIVASTSYRYNGWIMEDAAQDIINLRDYIVAEIAQPSEVYLMGNSMGAGIITWIAENAPDGFDGGLCMGAYLFEPIKPEAAPSATLGSHYSGRPNFPLLYLTNTSELEGPKAYIESVKEAAITPIIWPVDRFGHVNQNKAEQIAALEGLVKWVQDGSIDADRDGTITMSPRSTAQINDNELIGEVTLLVPVYGNFITNIVPSDMTALGLAKGNYFELKVGESETVKVLLGSNYQDVPVGDWVGFWEANGFLLICRNYKHAINSLDVALGEEVVLKML